jgi:hypothetical protein
MSSATTVEEALWLEAGGVDAIIAQGYEAGGHRGMFLATNLSNAIVSQPGTLPLVPQIVDAVRVPVIAAGGIADGRGIAAAFALGAAGTQLGTAYSSVPKQQRLPLYRDASGTRAETQTLMTNVFSGRPARIRLVNRLALAVGLILDAPLDFPVAHGRVTALCAPRLSSRGSTDFTPSGRVKPHRWEGDARQARRRSNWRRKHSSDSSNSAAFQSPARLRLFSSSLGSRSIAQTFLPVNLSGDVLRDICSPPDLGRRP